MTKGIIKRLRRILHKDEFNEDIETSGYIKVNPNKLKYVVTKQDLEYMQYFHKLFNTLSEKDQEKILSKTKTGNYKLFRGQYHKKEYIGSTTTTLFYFIRFNIYLTLNKDRSVFDNINSDIIGTEFTLLEIIKPETGTRGLVNQRKRVYQEMHQDTHQDVSNNDPFKIYIALYKDISCGGFGKKEPVFLYKGFIDNKDCLFLTRKKIDRLRGKQRRDIEEKLKTKQKIRIELLEKTYIHNELEEMILIDKYRSVYKPKVNTSTKLPEINNISLNMTHQQISDLKKIIFLRVNRERFRMRFANNKNSEYVYMFKNNVNGNGVIKHGNTKPENIIKKLYDHAITGSTSKLSLDLSTYDDSQFEFKILRVLKPDDNIKTVISRFQDKYNLSGYTPNMRQIYSIINARKKLN